MYRAIVLRYSIFHNNTARICSVYITCIELMNLYLATVEPHSALLCEVVFYPSYSTIFESDFVLQVEGGNQQHLHCSAEVRTYLFIILL